MLGCAGRWNSPNSPFSCRHGCRTQEEELAQWRQTQTERVHLELKQLRHEGRAAEHKLREEAERGIRCTHSVRYALQGCRVDLGSFVIILRDRALGCHELPQRSSTVSFVQTLTHTTPPTRISRMVQSAETKLKEAVDVNMIHAQEAAASKINQSLGNVMGEWNKAMFKQATLMPVNAAVNWEVRVGVLAPLASPVPVTELGTIS